MSDQSDQKPDLKVVSDDYELSEKDERDLRTLLEEAPAYHTLLEVWSRVLEPAEVEQNKKVTPQWAMRMVQSYPEVTFNQMNDLRDRFYGKIQELRNILQIEIEGDKGCLQFTTPETDAEENRIHYMNLLLNWQKQVLQWELDWDCADELAAVEIAAISEVHKMFFSDTGITAYLDQIGFQFSEEDSAELGAVLQEMKDGHE